VGGRLVIASVSLTLMLACLLAAAPGGGVERPASASAASCKVTAGRPAQELGPFGGYVIGRGPVYPVFEVSPSYEPGATGVVHYGHAVVDGLHYAKVQFIVSPTLRTPFVLSGESADGRRLMAFVGRDGIARRTLHVAAAQLQGHGPFGGWEAISSGVLVDGPGCYRLGVGLPSRSYSVSFRAAT
jgi:hypothetical protein